MIGNLEFDSMIYRSWQRINPTPCSSAQTSSPPTLLANLDEYLSILPPFSDEDFFSFTSSSFESYLSSAFSYFPYYYILLNPLDDDDDKRESQKKRRKRQNEAVLFVVPPYPFP